MTATGLIVDGSAAHLDVLERCLDGLDVQLLRTGSGNEALALVAEQDLAFIFLADQLPDMDGIEAIRLARCDRTRHHIPIILITTHERADAIMFRAYEAGAIDHLTKPLQRGVVRSKARVYLDLHACRAQISQQMRALSQSNREFQEFAHAAAHDLRAPLRAIKWLCGLLTEQGDDPEARGRVARSIAQGVGRMDALLKAMLEYATVEGERPKAGAVDLGACMKEVLADLSLEVAQCDAEVDVGVLPVLTGNAVQLRRLLQNIVGNALKYRRPAVPPVVRVHCTVAGDTAELRISDNGTGFDMKFADALFQPFRRLVPASSVEGSGIGMATAKKIVERHGGTISASSTVGEGSTFLVRLPMTGPEIAGFRQALQGKQGDPAQAASSPRAGAEAGERPDVAQPGTGERWRRRVLVVDDDDVDRRAAAQALDDALDVVGVDSAESALDLLDETVALVLTDYNMPGADGIWLLSRVAAAQPETRRLLMSGMPDGRCAEATRSGIVEHLLEKPIHGLDIRAWLRARDPDGGTDPGRP